MTEIRSYTEADRDELLALFARAGEGAPTQSLWGHLESAAAVYLLPYMEQEPESLFVSVGDGVLTGYLTGCVDSAAFPSESERMERAIKQYRLFTKRGPRRFFLRAMADTAIATLQRQPAAEDFADLRWPAHLHINIEPQARGTGAAQALMDAWLTRLCKAGSSGCHLQTVRENTRAVRFFTRMGFTPHGPAPAVPGLRYEGRRVHQLTMVQSL